MTKGDGIKTAAEEVPQTDGAWWRPYYEVAQQKQLLLRDDGTPFVGADETQMNNPITRYEMAVVLIQAYRGIAMPITKACYLVDDVTKLADTVREAFYLASHGRGRP